MSEQTAKILIDTDVRSAAQIRDLLATALDQPGIEVLDEEIQVKVVIEVVFDTDKVETILRAIPDHLAFSFVRGER